MLNRARLLNVLQLTFDVGEKFCLTDVYDVMVPIMRKKNHFSSTHEATIRRDVQLLKKSNHLIMYYSEGEPGVYALK